MSFFVQTPDYPRSCSKGKPRLTSPQPSVQQIMQSNFFAIYFFKFPIVNISFIKEIIFKSSLCVLIHIFNYTTYSIFYL